MGFATLIKHKSRKEFADLIWQRSKDGLHSLQYSDALVAADTVYNEYMRVVGVAEEYRDRLDRIDDEALGSGLNGTMSAMTKIHYLASR
jgi:hypothetical protein